MATRNRFYWLRAYLRYLRRLTRLPEYDAKHRNATAWDFIERYSADATKYGWQAAHLLGPRGLVERWWHFGCAPPRLFWSQREVLFKLSSGHWFGLRAEPDGSVRPLRGAELTALRGRCVIATELAA